MLTIRQSSQCNAPYLPIYPMYCSLFANLVNVMLPIYQSSQYNAPYLQISPM